MYPKPSTITKFVTLLNPKSPNTPNANIDFQKSPRQCFLCQGLGNIAFECPNKRVITLVDFELGSGYKFSSEFTNEQLINVDTDEEIMDLDEGECQVIRQALNITLTQEETLQCEFIFHTRYTISQRVCTLIINGSSCINVASQTLVDKLCLQIEPHPFSLHDSVVKSWERNLCFSPDSFIVEQCHVLYRQNFM